MKTINEQREVKRMYVKPAHKIFELDNTQMLAQSNKREWIRYDPDEGEPD